MPEQLGAFIWYELLTSDLAKAKAFYHKIFHWRIADSGQAEMHYCINHALDPQTGDEHPVGGMMQIDPEQCGEVKPSWLGYISVADVDRQIAAITEAGGQELMPPMDIPDVGRIAMVTDVQGVPFYIMKPIGDQPSLAFAFDRPQLGHCAWNELVSADTESAKAFYFSQFQWHKDGEMPLGPGLNYEFLKGQTVFGAMMPMLGNAVSAQWNYYFRVVDIDLAASHIVELGGQIVSGPDPIPGGEFSMNAKDPQSVPFALVGPRISA